MSDIVLINPRFEVSYWGLEHALPFMGKRANMPVACLPLLAALTPPEHTVTLIDENVEAIDFARCACADVVGVTGMSVQRFRMKEILAELKRRGGFTVVGGPWVTLQEDYFGESADVTFIGEAEETWPRFLREWEGGRHGRRYEQAEKSDMTTVPVPRFDLLKMRHYLFGSLQFSAVARSSASSATSSSPSAAARGSSSSARSWPSSRPCSPRGWRSSSSSTTT